MEETIKISQRAGNFTIEIEYDKGAEEGELSIWSHDEDGRYKHLEFLDTMKHEDIYILATGMKIIADEFSKRCE
jgi:hypothetical protein